MLTFVPSQNYISCVAGENHFDRINYNCPYRKKCGCYVAFAVKKYKDKVILMQAGEHTPDSHLECTGILSVKQRGTIKRMVRAAPMAVGTQVHANLQHFSPGRRVPYDERSRAAVSRLTRKEREVVLDEQVPGGIKLDGSEGSMNQLADELSLDKLLARHNDPTDSFHMDAHKVVCLGHQFSDGVRFATFSTPHFLNNMPRAKNCGWQAQGHTDGAFDWCGKEIALIGFGMNSMGAHFNPVSFSLVNSESKEGIKNSYLATCAGLYTLYNSAVLCQDPECGFCTQVKAQITDQKGKATVWQQQLLSEDAQRGHYQLDNPSSDNSCAYFATGKELFGPDTAIGQCGHHLSCKLLFHCFISS